MLKPTGSLRLPHALRMAATTVMVAVWAMVPALAEGKVIERAGEPPATPETPAVVIDDARVLEGDDGLRKLQFQVRLSAPSDHWITVDARTLDTTATLADLDYAPLQLQVAFEPGTVSQWLSVVVRGDKTIEDDESLLVRLSNVQNATLADSEAVGTIENDDFVKVLAIDDASVLEGDAGTQPLTFTLHLSPPAVDPVMVQATAFDSTATLADADYEASSTLITFAPGDSLATFTVPVVGDTQLEHDELLIVRLTALTGGVFADSEAVGTLVHDDLPTLAIADSSLLEGQGGLDSLRFAITLSAPALDTVTFVASTFDSTAQAGQSDYYATNSTITVLPGDSTAAFAVAVLGDKRVEGDEQLVVRLSQLRGATFADSEAVGTIIDDDVPVLSVSDTTMFEGDSSVTTLAFRVQLSAAARMPVSFHYQTFDGTALAADGDYLPASGDTTIEAGQSQIVIPVTAFGDTLLEANERFTLQLSGITNATAAETLAVGALTNDERVRFSRFTTGVPMYWPGTLPPAFGDLTGDGLPDLPMYSNTGTTFVEMPGVRAALGNGNYHGAAWCDFDRDGDMDFVQMPYGQEESSDNRVHLFLNDAPTLTDVAPALGLDVMGYGETPNWGDFNADGWPDLFLPFYAHTYPFHSYLFLNQGGSSFIEASDPAGIALRDLPAGRRPEGTSVVDWDGNGTLDVYCGNHLLLNDGDARFTDVRAAVGLPQIFDEGSQFVDYDDDGDFDLYLRTINGPTLFRNDAGQYTNVTPILGIGTVAWEWGDRWADLDGDGDMDLMYFPPSTEARLVLNHGDGTFAEDTTFRGSIVGSSLASYADIDGDGDLDIAAGANGRQFARNLSEAKLREHATYLKVRVEDEAGRLVMHGATVRLRSLDDPRHPVQSRIVDGGSGYLGQDEYTITFNGLGSGRYELEVSFPSKPDARRIVGPAQNPALGDLRPGMTGPQLIVVRPTGDVSQQPHGQVTASAPSTGDGPALAARMSGPSPNPARSLTRIALAVPASGPALSLAIHDVNGRRVRTLRPSAERLDVTWDLCDDAGRRVAPGMYFARVAGSDAAARSQRIIVLQ